MRARPGLVLGAAAPAALFWCSACGGGAPLDSFQAARLIQDHSEFRQLKTITLERVFSGPCGASTDYSDTLLRFRSLGLAELREEAGWKEGRRQAFCRVVLSEDARRDIDSMGMSGRDAPTPAAEHGEIPIASPNFVRLNGVTHPDAHTAEVSFVWQWQPNVVGRKLGISAELKSGTATLWLFDDEWRIRSLRRME